MPQHRPVQWQLGNRLGPQWRPGPGVLVGVAAYCMCRTAQGDWNNGGWPVCAHLRQARIKSCDVCQMHSKAPSEAPIAGHITASRPGEGWVVDVLHMEESSEGTFWSRWRPNDEEAGGA